MTKESLEGSMGADRNESREGKKQKMGEAGLDVTYRRNLHRSHMCIRAQGTAGTCELKMMEGKQIPHLLKLEITVMEGETYYLYDISGKQQIDDYLSGKKMRYEILWRLLFSIKELCRVLPDYLLREAGVCLKEEYIYVNLEDGSLYFTYLPFWQESLPEAFERYMEGILRKTDHQDQAATELVYQVYQNCLAENASVHKILETAMAEQKKQEPGEEKKEKSPEEYFSAEIPEETAAEKKKLWEKAADRIKIRPGSHTWFCQFSEQLEKLLEKEMFSLKKKNSGQEKKTENKKPFRNKSSGRKLFQKAEFWKKKEEKPDLSFSKAPAEAKPEECVQLHPTEILAVRGQDPMGKLIYQGIHGCGDILITGDEFLIGKNRQQAQGIIEAEGISRLHARISRQEMEYYLEDLNSTNGTYLNEIPLEYHQKKAMCRNDRVRFGAEEYMFV